MPCSPGMTQCKASCLHRSWVMDHRNEMSAWLVKNDNQGLGYATEMKEAAQKDPAPRLWDAMMHREKPPENWQNQEHPVETPDKLTGEMSPEESWKAWQTERQELIENRPLQDQQDDVQRAIHQDRSNLTLPRPGNRGAEEGLLSAAMADERAVPFLKQLGPAEFTSTPYTEPIARAIVELESQGIRANATAVEDRLRTKGIVASEASWDSAAYMGEHRTAAEVHTAEPGLAPLPHELHGLERWEATAMPYQAAESFAQEIRSHSYSTGTAEAYQWGSDRLAGIVADTGPHPALTQHVQAQVQSKIDALPQPLPRQQELAELKNRLSTLPKIPVGAQVQPLMSAAAGRTR